MLIMPKGLKDINSSTVFVHKKENEASGDCRHFGHPDSKPIWIFMINCSKNTSFLPVFENHRKSLIQPCEQSELRLHFEWTKVIQKCQKLPILASQTSNSVTRQANFNRTKIGGKYQNSKTQMRHFE